MVLGSSGCATDAAAAAADDDALSVEVERHELSPAMGAMGASDSAGVRAQAQRRR